MPGLTIKGGWESTVTIFVSQKTHKKQNSCSTRGVCWSIVMASQPCLGRHFLIIYKTFPVFVKCSCHWSPPRNRSLNFMPVDVEKANILITECPFGNNWSTSISCGPYLIIHFPLWFKNMDTCFITIVFPGLK